MKKFILFIGRSVVNALSILFLVAGVAFGMTGAWFTDAEKETSATLQFGDVEIALTGTGIHT